ncbi:MAG TPA: hypothetical protein VFZ53_29920 [Polyangiaceae bacterium]
MKLRRPWLLVFVALGCNEVLGLKPGKPQNEETGGTAGSGASAGSAMGGNATSGTSGTSGRSGATNAGESGASGEAGSPASGGTAAARGGGGGAAGESGAGSGGDDDGGCSTVECRAEGFDFCIEGKCADVTSPECDTIIGDEWIENDPGAEPHLFGALTRFEPTDPEAYRFYANLKLAMQEFSAHGRIPIEGREGRPVLLLCRAPTASNDLRPLREGLNHLIQGLDVSSVLMFVYSRAELQTLVESQLVVLGEDAFFLDYAGATSALLRLPDDADDDIFDPDLASNMFGRLWHMLGDTTLVLESFPPLVERIEEHVNPGAAAGGASRPTRLAFVTGTADGFDNEIALSLSDASSRLRINGAFLREQPDRVRSLGGFDATAAAAELADFGADIVLDFSGSAALEPLVDAAYRARSARPPFYVFPPGRYRWPILLDQIEDDASLRTRILGVNHASAVDLTLYEAYMQRLRRIGPSTVDLESMENVYDAVYFAIYAAVAGTHGGTGQAKGFRRLLAGPRRDMGPDAIQSVVDRLVLSSDATLTLHGPGGTPDFHVRSGGRMLYGNVWCIDENVGYVADALRYDSTSDGFPGILPCFEF